MEPINPYVFYQIGHDLHPLSGREGNQPARDVFFLVMDARLRMRDMLDGNPVKLGVSRPAAEDFKQVLDGIATRHFTDEKSNWKWPTEETAAIPSWEWGSVKAALQTFESVFRAEMQATPAYVPPERGTFLTAALVDHGEKSFPENLHHVIGEKAIVDFKSATRCYAFNLPTASGYHSARAVEAVLETYYQTFTNRPGETLNGWNDYCDALGKLKSKKPKPKFIPDPRTLLSIDGIRSHHRNPLMHPRAVLTETDADVLLSIAKVAIIGMATEINLVWQAKKEAKAKQKTKLAAVGAAPVHENALASILTGKRSES